MAKKLTTPFEQLKPTGAILMINMSDPQILTMKVFLEAIKTAKLSFFAVANKLETGLPIVVVTNNLSQAQPISFAKGVCEEEAGLSRYINFIVNPDTPLGKNTDYIIKSNAKPEGPSSSKIQVAHLAIGHALILSLPEERGVNADNSISFMLPEKVATKKMGIK
ncbi:MAG: hypothetical protein ACP5RX_01715 [Minisyncoccia bacterium]